MQINFKLSTALFLAVTGLYVIHRFVFKSKKAEKELLVAAGTIIPVFNFPYFNTNIFLRYFSNRRTSMFNGGIRFSFLPKVK